jgi:thioredoxin-dependent adenylylsulfate APS reductase
MTAVINLDGTGLAEVARELNHATPQEILTWTFARFPRTVIVASFQAESSVLIDMASRLRPRVAVLTLDTGRLPQETHDMIDRVRERYDIELEILAPAADDVSAMTSRHGTNLFYASPELRQLCCDTRKSRPLARALERYDAWITGLRRDQGATRAQTPIVQLDAAHGGIAKVAPLAGWTSEQVWEYITKADAPTHELYRRGYTSIGCAPCTRATQPGEDPRAGRWWWERDGVKECGLHWRAQS